MDQVKRPTCVTVIGWIWILGGGLALAATLVAIGLGAWIQTMPWVVVVQVSFTALCFVAGFFFLRLQPWARSLVEALTWAMLTLWIALLVYFLLATQFGFASGVEPLWVFVGLLVVVVYGVSLVIVLQYLRSGVVRRAFLPRSHRVRGVDPTGV